MDFSVKSRLEKIKNFSVFFLMMKGTFYSELLFWVHLPIVIFWFGLFFIPKSIWPERVFFHFWMIISIMAIQVIWSLVIFRKFNLICPITTWMQSCRGYTLKSKKNYGHSFIAELCGRLGFNVYFKSINIALLITLLIVVIQYIWFRCGIR